MKTNKIYICPNCIIKCTLIEVNGVHENVDLLSFNCPKCGEQTMLGKKTEIELASIARASAWSLGWNVRFFWKVILESIKQRFKQ